MDNTNLRKTTLFITILLSVSLIVTLVPRPVAAETTSTTSPNCIVYEKLLNDRHFVIDTFTRESFPEDNPHAAVRACTNDDYMYKDIMDNYDLDPVIAVGVDVYYRAEHLEEILAEIPSALLDLFPTDESWTSYIAGAQNKSYETVLNGIYSTDYTSDTGLSMGSDLGDLQDLRTTSDYASDLKEVLEYGSDIESVLGALNSEYKLKMVNETLPSYADSIDRYISGIDDILNKAEANTGKKKKTFNDLFEAKYYSMYKTKEDGDDEWLQAMNEGYTTKRAGKVLKYLELTRSLIGGTMENALMIESLLRQREQLYGTLERTREKALENGDNGFARVSKRYLDLMSNDDLSESGKEALAATVLAVSDELRDTIESAAWDSTGTIIKNIIASKIATSKASKQATSIVVANQLAKLSDVITYTTMAGDLVTDFGDVCEKIYEIRYLNNIRNYVCELYQEDENAYTEAKASGASMETLDGLAKKALDDLYMLKQLTLRANEVGYKICKGEAESFCGIVISWIAGNGSSDIENIENEYAKSQSALVDTLIDPIPQTPILVESGETLTVQKTANNYSLTLTTTGAETIKYGEPEYRLYGGIILQGGTVVFDNRTDEDIFVSSIYARTGSNTMQIIGDGDVTASLIGTSAELLIESESTGEINTTTIEDNKKLSINNVTLNIEDNLMFPTDTYFSTEDSSVNVGGDFRAEGYQSHATAGVYIDAETTMTIKGDMYFKNTSTESNRKTIAGLEGTIELEGDLIDESSEYYGWSGEPTIKMTGDKVQTLDYRTSNGDSYGYIGTLEVYCPGIKVERELAVNTLGTDVKILSDVNGLDIRNELVDKTIEIAGNTAIGWRDSVKLGQNAQLKNGGSFTVDYSRGANYVSGGAYFNEGSNVKIVGDFKTLEGGYCSATGSSISIEGNVMISKDSYYSAEDSSVNVGGDFRAEGYQSHATAGVYIDAETTMTIKGNMHFKNNATESGSKTIASLNGTIELEGDLIDESPEYYGWGIGTLKLIGDKVQTLDYRASTDDGYGYGYIDTLEVYCPGIKVERELAIYTLGTDLIILSDVDRLNIRNEIVDKTIEIAGNTAIGWRDSVKLGQNAKLKNGGSFTVNYSKGSYDFSGGAYFNEGSSADIAGDFKLLEGGCFKATGSMINIEGNLIISKNSYYSAADSSINVGGDFRAEGYENHATAGVYTDSKTTLKIKGNMHFKNNATESGSKTIASLNGTIELEGDLIDKSPEYYGWAGYLTLKLNGDKVQTLDCRTNNDYNKIWILEEYCPGIKVERELAVNTLGTDIDILNGPTRLALYSWNGKTINLHNVTSFPTVNFRDPYSMKLTAGENESYNVTYAPTAEDTYKVNYIIDGQTVQTVSNYAAGSLIIPYEMLGNTEIICEWYTNQEATEPFNMLTNTVTKNTNLYGVDVTETIQALKSELSQLLETAHELNEEDYTEETYADFAEAVANADSVLANACFERVALEDAINALTVAMEGLVCNHNYAATVTEPTCTVGGYTTYSCTRCGDTYVDDETLPKGHSFGEWIVIQDSSCTEEGSQQRICSACGLTETEGIDMKEHNFATEFTIDQEPTCIEDGSQSYHCMNEGCSAVTGSEAIPATGHAYEETVTPATFVQSGSVDMKCENCGDTQHVRDIASLKSAKLSATTYTYNGKAQMPVVTVTDSKGVLIPSGSYNVKYSSGRKNVGTYKVTVTMKGSYSGTQSLSFKINPKGTAISKLTSSTKAFTAKWKKQTTQTTGYQIMIATNSKFTAGKKTIKVTKNSTGSKKITKLKAKKKYYVKIRTYKKVNGTMYYSAWSKAKRVTTK